MILKDLHTSKTRSQDEKRCRAETILGILKVG